ncbi:Zinc finger, FYVE/PHD-type [Sesbania bispinosa]|nr:Zinc finger, FYVE/PHD-type [Sesbania bispinosa]
MKGHPWYGDWGYQFGSGSYGLTQEAYKTTVERWTVDCSCGAKDDDGERMLACNICGVW